MNDIAEILTRLCARKSGQEMVDAIKSEAFGAVGQMHRHAQHLSHNAVRLENHLKGLEKMLNKAIRLEPSLASLVTGTTRQKAIVITRACILK